MELEVKKIKLNKLQIVNLQQLTFIFLKRKKTLSGQCEINSHQ